MLKIYLMQIVPILDGKNLTTFYIYNGLVTYTSGIFSKISQDNHNINNKTVDENVTWIGKQQKYHCSFYARTYNVHQSLSFIRIICVSNELKIMWNNEGVKTYLNIYILCSIREKKKGEHFNWNTSIYLIYHFISIRIIVFTIFESNSIHFTLLHATCSLLHVTPRRFKFWFQ